MEERIVAFERPRPDPELRPALTRMPDAVRFGALAGRERVIVRVPAAAVEVLLRLDRPAQWRDFDAAWPAIADAAERRIVDGDFDLPEGNGAGLPVVTLGRPTPRIVPGGDR